MTKARKRARLAYLRASEALWKRRHALRVKRAEAAARRGDTAGYRKWRRLYLAAGVELRRRRSQIKKLIATPAKKPPAPPARARVVARAASYIGVTERYYNGGGIINVWQARFGFGRVAWCGLFCGNMMVAVGVRGVSARIAAVALIEQDARAHNGPFRGWSTDERSAQRGDLAVIGSYGQHVEMVELVHPDGSLTTIGGNTGNAVRRMRRSRAVVRGIAHVNYPG